MKDAFTPIIAARTCASNCPRLPFVTLGPLTNRSHRNVLNGIQGFKDYQNTIHLSCISIFERIVDLLMVHASRFLEHPRISIFRLLKELAPIPTLKGPIQGRCKSNVLHNHSLLVAYVLEL